MKSIMLKPDAGDNLQSSLSTKISVIVFWGMILVGLCVSFFLLHGREEKIAEEYANQANSFAYDIDEYIHRNGKFLTDRLEGEMQRLIVRHHAEGVEINLDGKITTVGIMSPGRQVFDRQFAYHPG